MVERFSQFIQKNQITSQAQLLFVSIPEKASSFSNLSQLPRIRRLPECGMIPSIDKALRSINSGLQVSKQLACGRPCILRKYTISQTLIKFKTFIYSLLHCSNHHKSNVEACGLQMNQQHSKEGPNKEPTMKVWFL